MSALEQLNGYLRRLEQRLRLLAASRGIAVAGVSALMLTVLLVWIANRFAFAESLVFPLRVLLFLGLSLVVSFALVIPLMRLNRRTAARRAEREFPDFQERLLTLAEKNDKTNPFAELLADDALKIANRHSPERLAPIGAIFGLLLFAVAGIGVLAWLIAAGPGYLGYGASLLWAGQPRAGTPPFYEIVVHPGNRTIRRKTDEIVTAQLLGFTAPKVALWARYRDSAKWEQAPMQPQSDSNGYEFLFAGLPDSVEYYVTAGPVTSKHYKLEVADLPGVKRVRVAYHYPEWLGLKDVVQDPGGDVRAVEGTEAEISVETDRPLKQGSLVLDGGARIDLAPGAGNWLTARLTVKKDGSYHVAAIESGEPVRISEDYFIEAKKDEPPTVKITRPGKDPRVSPIEEVPITVEASDDFGIQGLDLHYSVNGGDEKTVSLLPRKGEKDANGKTTLYLENFKLVPGDLVSFYATARDAHQTARTDIFFAQAEPFDLSFRQAQAAGGMGGGGQDDTQISERQKELIAATWNEIKNGSKSGAAMEESARFLSGVEGKLGQQAHDLAARMRSREMAGADTAFDSFSKEMDRAAAETGNAVGQLKGAKWHEALSPEQKALQALLRAEAMFHDIQVAFQASNGGQGGGGASRDLARMLDLELDTAKNQYETGDQRPSASAKDKEMDTLMQKLADLARRQQELASRRQQEQAFRQRWEQEMLRREAEELRRQMEQLSQNGLSRQQQGNSSQQRSQSQSGQQSGQQSQQQANGSPSGSRSMGQSGSASSAQMQQALQSLQQAEEAMRQSASQHDAGAEQRAASALAQAQNLLGQMQRQQAANALSDLTRRAAQQAEHQKDFANRLRQMYAGSESAQGQDPRFGPRPGTPSLRTGQLANEKEKMAAELQQLEQEMQQRAQGLAGGQPDASRKLNQALGEAQQEELALRMKKSAEWIREGQGVFTWIREGQVTMGMEHLRDQLQQAQGTLSDQQAQNGKPGGQGGDQGQEAARQAMAQLQRLRENLGRATGQARERGGNNPSPGAAIGEAEHELSGMERNPGLRGPITSQAGDLANSLGYMRTQGDPAELARRINNTILPGLDRLDAELRRKAGEVGGEARTASPDKVPQGYQESVAEYFRRLSSK